MVRRLRTTDCGKFDSLEKYAFELKEEDATIPEFSADPLYQKKMDIFSVKKIKTDEKRVEHVTTICLLARRNPCKQIDIVYHTTR